MGDDGSDLDDTFTFTELRIALVALAMWMGDDDATAAERVDRFLAETLED